jgi:hypothetical protein
MDAEILKTVGQIAGIGGLALGVFLLLFRDIIRKSIFPTLSKTHAYRLLALSAVLIWSVALAGIGAWVWVETNPPGLSGPPSSATVGGPGIANTGQQTFQGPVSIGAPPSPPKGN